LNDPRLPALRRVRPPAFLLLCVGSLNTLFCLVSLVIAGALALGWQPPEKAALVLQNLQQQNSWALILTIAGAVVAGVLSIWGALSAFSLRGWGLVVVGSVTSMFPLTPTCCLGVFVGAWMLWVLSQPEVRQHFQ
jgi:hypothetical protein